MSFAPDTETFAKPQVLFRVPVGMVSPLWGLFAGAAMTGATWWWMTRWARPQNLEAMFGGAAEAEAVIAPETAAFAAPEAGSEAVIEAIPEPIVEAAAEAEPFVDAAAAATREPILESIVEVVPISPEREIAAPETAEPLMAVEFPAEAAADLAQTPKPKKKAIVPEATPTSD